MSNNHLMDAYDTVSPTGTMFDQANVGRYNSTSSGKLSNRLTRRVLKLIPPSLRYVITRPFVLLLLVSGTLLSVIYILNISPYIPLLPSWSPNQLPTSEGGYGPTLPTIYEPYLPTLSIPPLLNQHPILADALTEFLHRPIHTYDKAFLENNVGCPMTISDQLVNPDQLSGSGSFWREVGVERIAEKRADLIGYLEELLERGERILGDEGMGGGRGIVLTGGNQDTTDRLLTLLRILRRQGCTLPVEVFHFPDELTDGNQRRQIEELGGVIKLIRGVEKDFGSWKNWQIKGLAIVQSSFREVLSLDSDNIPLRDPANLFTAPHYLSSNKAVFWPDISKDHTTNSIWRAVGLPCTFNDWTFESGEILIDKAGNNGLNLAALWLASGMMRDGDSKDFWFKMCGGDKDTYRWAFEILGIEFGRSLRWLSALGFLNGFEGGRFCGHTMLQYDIVIPEGMDRPPPLFVHSNLLKHIGSAGLTRGRVFTHLKRLTLDDYSESTANNGHMWVYQGTNRGMCLDLELLPRTASLGELEEFGQRVETIELEDVEGDVFRGFEDIFWDEGGRVGGW